MKKKLTALCLVVALLAIAVVGGSLAYFTDKDDATNTFTVGNVDITLTEPSWTASGSKDAPEVYPGEALDKDPTVTNVGANPCFVRVKVTMPQGWENLIATEAGNDYHGGNTVNAGWVLKDGYYYYTKPLCVQGAEGESYNAGLTSETTPLFDRVRISKDLTNNITINADGKTYQYAGNFNIEVKAEAVQAQGAMGKWADVKNMDVNAIAAWFGTCMAG